MYSQMQRLKYRIPEPGTNVCLLLVLCVVRYKSGRQNYHWSRGVFVLVCACVCTYACACEFVCLCVYVFERVFMFFVCV
jgi:hypothetical protein